MESRKWRKDLGGPDPFLVFLGRMGRVLFDRSRELLLGAVALLLLSLGLLGWHAWKERRDGKAADAFEKIMEPYGAGEPEWEKLAADLEAFLKERKRTDPARMARLYRARALLATGKHGEAIEAFRAASKRLRRPYRYLAQEGEALALMELQRWDEAEAVWLKLAGARDNPLRARHTWNLGLTQEGARRISKAMTTYQEFETKFPNSPLLDKVRSRLDALGKGSPIP